jgi:hypothetical protein
MFDLMVKDGRMPDPKWIDGRVVWDRNRVEAYWADLPDEDSNENNPLDRYLMPQRLPEYCVEDRDRHGNIRIYFKKRGCRKVRLKGYALDS